MHRMHIMLVRKKKIKKLRVQLKNPRIISKNIIFRFGFVILAWRIIFHKETFYTLIIIQTYICIYVCVCESLPFSVEIFISFVFQNNLHLLVDIRSYLYTLTWKQDLVRELYSTKVAAGCSILATPISRGGVSDKLIWRHVKHDRYEVKIGFQLLQALEVRVTQVMDSHWRVIVLRWRNLWSLKLPLKLILIFCVRVLGAN